MVTKQVHKRQLLFSENEVVRQVVLYTMAYCAKHYNIALHSIMVEGNHYHRADTDADAKRPLFNQTCHALIAKQLNVYYKERDALFSNQQTSVVESANGNDTLKRIAYSMGNPVKDGIDRESKSYKGR